MADNTSRLHRYRLAAVVMTLILMVISKPSWASDDNYNEGAAASASETAINNANCNSALILGCDETGFSFTSPEETTHGKNWETGKEAFPGSDVARETTVSWQSGRTNAVFAAPFPAIGGSSPLIILAVLVFGFIRCRWKTDHRRPLDRIYWRVRFETPLAGDGYSAGVNPVNPASNKLHQTSRQQGRIK